MEIIIGADHRGFEMKEQLHTWLSDQGYNVIDVGSTTKTEDDDYPQYALAAAQAVAENPTARKGILLCGSGAGMAIAANKVRGIRAVLVHDVTIATSARNDDDVNVLALGADYISLDDAKEVIQAFIKTPFSGEERHVRRVGEIEKMEEK